MPDPVMRTPFNYLALAGAAMVGLLSFLVFYQLLIVQQMETDIQIHVRVTRDILTGDMEIQPNFVFYLFTMILGGFSKNYDTLLYAGMACLALAKGATYFVSARIMHSFILRHIPDVSPTRLAIFTLLSCFALAFAFSIPLEPVAHYYLGRLPPNVWHNSTTILLTPFALGLFWRSYRHVAGESTRLWPLFLLIFLNVYIKPTFFIALAPVYCVFLLSRLYKSPRQLIWQATPLVAGFFMIVAIYLSVYYFQLGTIQDEASRMRTGFLRGWSHYGVPYEKMPEALLASIAFGAAAGPALMYQYASTRKMLFYATCVFWAAMFIFLYLYEDGARRGHGNMSWQAIVANHVSFFACAVALGVSCFSVRRTSGYVFSSVLLLLLGIHFIAGLGYLIKLFVSHSYL